MQEDSPNSKIRVLRKNKIVNFYYRKYVSYTFPWMKDYVMVKGNEGKRVKMIKHVLILVLREAHSEFCSQELHIKISLDTFLNLHPPNVLLRHKMPKNVCVCVSITPTSTISSLLSIIMRMTSHQTTGV